MDWVKLGVRYYLDPAIRGLTDDVADAAEVMFTRGLARAGEVGGAGFIPEQDVELLTRRRRYGAVVDALLRSGLWTRAAGGGYLVTHWSDWQDHLDALTRKRTADRDRQRRRRAAAKDGVHVSRDGHATVAAVEKEKEKDLQGGVVSVTHYRARAELEPPAEPPTKCDKHATTAKPPNCGACADARREHGRWEAERNKRLASAPKCRMHRGQPADNCANCRSEELNPA